MCANVNKPSNKFPFNPKAGFQGIYLIHNKKIFLLALGIHVDKELCEWKGLEQLVSSARGQCNHMGLLGRAFEHWFHLSMQLLQRMEMKVCPCRKTVTKETLELPYANWQSGFLWSHSSPPDKEQNTRSHQSIYPPPKFRTYVFMQIHMVTYTYIYGKITYIPRYT